MAKLRDDNNADLPYLRPLDLRAAAFRQLDASGGMGATGDKGRQAAHGTRNSKADAIPATKDTTLRIMTYNVHACIGMDGRLSPARIARVIAQSRVDVVALQELDVRRQRTGQIDQAREIAHLLEMEFHFHPAWSLQEEQYGNALLSRHPLRLVRSGQLPGLDRRPRLEPRGALWVELTVDGHCVQLLNTHLGLRAGERLAQVETLLGPEWLGSGECRGPVVLCGDFNSPPRSRPYAQLCRRMRDVQCEASGHRPLSTWLILQR